MLYTCPVCFYDALTEPPRDYNICECCGTEFGNDDAEVSPDYLRANWIAEGCPWFYGAAPFGWNPWGQLIRANVSALPYYVESQFESESEVFTSTICEEPCYELALAG